MSEHPVSQPQRVLLTGVCGPIGPRHGDGPSVGYELLHAQITRSQGIFSPRSVDFNYSLDYISENLECPAVVLQYPQRRELIRELKRGYDYVGVSFILALFHHLKDTVALIRKYAPQSKIVLGGYGTVLPDEVLKPYADFICREEGVSFFRRLLGEPEIQPPYRQPIIVTNMRLFSQSISKTGMIFGGLGCPNGCDFCCTSHFFKRKHIKLLPEGRDIYAVIERYLELEPGMTFIIHDEDFLFNRKRAMEFRECVLKGGKALSIFVFASVRAISQYTVEEILEMGIDGFWIGYEGTRSDYAKQSGRPVGEIFREFREHGITILASMIVGFDYQTPAVIAEELDGLMKLKPVFSQFLIYGPTPGTPFYERVVKEGRLREDLATDTDEYCHACNGFTSMVKHPTMSPEEIEALQRWCYDEDFQRLGPSIFRTVETWILGYRKLKDSDHPMLRKRADRFAEQIRAAYPVFSVGDRLGPNKDVSRWIRELERQAHAEFGPATWKERAMALALYPVALWTAFTLKADLFQHPKPLRNLYRMPERRP